MGELAAVPVCHSLHLDVFKYVRTAQAQYGLKHADYTRYR